MGPVLPVDLQVGCCRGPSDGGCPPAPGPAHGHPARDRATPGLGWGWLGNPSPSKTSACLGGGVPFGTIPAGSKSLPCKGPSFPGLRLRLIHAEVVVLLNPLLCSCIICLHSHITLTKSKEEIYLLYFAFRQPCPATAAPILIDYTAIFLYFSCKYDAAPHLNHLSRNPLQRPYHSNFSHILCLCVRVWYFSLISSPSPLQ